MMRQTGNIWNRYGKKDEILLVTTNSTIRKDGNLVMGKGIALQASTRLPELAEWAGRIIRPLSTYGLLLHPTAPIGLFQTKRDWRADSPLDLIAHSANLLGIRAEGNPATIYNLPCPGIGNGGLKIEDVLPLLEPLPNNVHVWTLK